MNNEMIDDIKDMRKALCDIEEMARNSTTFPENLDDYYKIRGIAGSAWQWSVIALGDDNELDIALTQQQEAEPVAWVEPRGLQRLKEGQLTTLASSGNVRETTIPLYLHPPAAQALTEQEQNDMGIGARWRRDSSLETWFPYTAQRLAELEAKAAQPQVPEGKVLVDRGWLLDTQQTLAQIYAAVPSLSGSVFAIHKGIESMLSAAKEAS